MWPSMTVTVTLRHMLMCSLPHCQQQPDPPPAAHHSTSMKMQTSRQTAASMRKGWMEGIEDGDRERKNWMTTRCITPTAYMLLNRVHVLGCAVFLQEKDVSSVTQHPVGLDGPPQGWCDDAKALIGPYWAISTLIQCPHAVRMHIWPRTHPVCFSILGLDYGGPSHVEGKLNGRLLTQVHQRRSFALHWASSTPSGVLSTYIPNMASVS